MVSLRSAWTDASRTFELNPSEIERFRHDFAEVLRQPIATEWPLAERASTTAAPKIVVETGIKFDAASSERCTVMEIVTQDRPGLLHLMASTMACFHCNIEVGLIDTEGQKAIDVFYLTRDGQKLSRNDEALLQEALKKALA